MKSKEINNIIYEKLGSFLKEQGKFKVLKKRSGFTCKLENNIVFNLIFTSINRSDYHKYEFSLGIYLEDIEIVLNEALGMEISDFMGYAEVLDLYYISNIKLNESLDWEIWDIDDVYLMLEEVEKHYYSHIINFIANNSSYEKILMILESIAFREVDAHLFERILIISKLKGIGKFEDKKRKYREVLIKSNNIYLEEFDKVVSHLNKNY